MTRHAFLSIERCTKASKRMIYEKSRSIVMSRSICCANIQLLYSCTHQEKFYFCSRITKNHNNNNSSEKSRENSAFPTLYDSCSVHFMSIKFNDYYVIIAHSIPALISFLEQVEFPLIVVAAWLFNV